MLIENTISLTETSQKILFVKSLVSKHLIFDVFTVIA